MLLNLGKIFLQLVYDCTSKDTKNLETLQTQIQERIYFLNEANMNSYNDPKLLEYYELYNQIQQCLFADHSNQYLLYAGIILRVSLFVVFRWWMIRKVESKKKLNFK
ncbi:MAG: hypothetical protein IIC67_06255 [Thaumarchaeota archaeon]|nr:hypothetical protein [Nitrososphaerota archaeon]